MREREIEAKSTEERAKYCKENINTKNRFCQPGKVCLCSEAKAESVGLCILFGDKNRIRRPEGRADTILGLQQLLLEVPAWELLQLLELLLLTK